MPELDPATLPGARECQAFTLDASGRSLTVWADVGPDLRLFVAEEPDAVHVTVVPTVRERDVRNGQQLHEAWVGGPSSAVARLNAPLGRRPVIDATTGLAARKLPQAPIDEVEQWISPAEAKANRKRTARIRRSLGNPEA